MNDKITFSFGENWRDYLSNISETEIESAMKDICSQLEIPTSDADAPLAGKSVIDIGSGSGIHSLSFHRLGVEALTSVDVDPHSVTATESMWERAGKPDNWKVVHGSILDNKFVGDLNTYDIVYSWGVLHHTGSMWEAIDNAMKLVKPGGQIWIALYAKGPRYAKDLALKKKYNAATDAGKRWMVRKWILQDMFRCAKRFKNPFVWYSKSRRGMNKYHDLIDWLGGLPYEVANPDEVTKFALARGFVMEGIQVANQGGCSDFIMRSVPGIQKSVRCKAA